MASHWLYIQSYLESGQAPSATTISAASPRPGTMTSEGAITLALGRIDGKAKTTPKDQAALDAAVAAAFDVSGDPFAAYYPSYVYGFVGAVAGVAIQISESSGGNPQVAAMAVRLGTQDGQASSLRARSAIATELQGVF